MIILDFLCTICENDSRIFGKEGKKDGIRKFRTKRGISLF